MLTSYEEFKVRSDVEHALLLMWSLVVLLTSLVGDGILLMATIKHNAIKQRKLIVAVMQHMAVCDLLQIIFRVFPVTRALIEKQWIVGELICHAEANKELFTAAFLFFLTSALTSLKLLTIEHPHRAKLKICCSLWFVTLSYYFPFSVLNMVEGDGIYFYEYEYTCDNGDHYRNNGNYDIFHYFREVVMLISLLVVMVTSIITLLSKMVASGHQRRKPWGRIAAALLTVGVLVTSHLPSVVATPVVSLGYDYPGAKAARAVTYLQYLSILANFFVYALAVRSLRQYLRLTIIQVLFNFLDLSNYTPLQ